jgi:type II secretory pathway component PulL
MGRAARAGRHIEKATPMDISEWLDKKEAEGVDVSQIVVPDDLLYDAAPDEVVFFQVVNQCSILCSKNHPFSTVERFGHWYYCRGQDKKAGIHSTGKEWWFFTRNKDLAVKTAKSHIE